MTRDSSLQHPGADGARADAEMLGQRIGVDEGFAVSGIAMSGRHVGRKRTRFACPLLLPVCSGLIPPGLPRTSTKTAYGDFANV